MSAASETTRARPKQICERRRPNVRLRVHLDGQLVLDKSYEPRGIWHDGNSIAIERLTSSAGEHQVKIELGDTPDPNEWTHVTERRVSLLPRHLTVVSYDKLEGFSWYE